MADEKKSRKDAKEAARKATTDDDIVGKAYDGRLMRRLLTYLRSRNDCMIVGQSVNSDSKRVPTIAFRFDGREAADLCKAMDEYKIAMRFGDFHSRRLAEYLDLTDQGGMLRVSMVHYNTLEEVDRFTAALDRILSSNAGLAKAS